MEQRWGLPFIAWPSRLRPTLWDLVAIPLVLGGMIVTGIGFVIWGFIAPRFAEPRPVALRPAA